MSLFRVGVSLGAVLRSAAVFSLFSGSVSAETLEEAIEQALATNPDVSSVVSNREAVDQELLQARGLYLPQIDVSGDLGYGNEIEEGYVGRSQTEGTGPRGASLTVRQRLFDGWEAGSMTERELARVESAANRVKEVSEFLALDAIGAYAEVLRQRELVELSKENVEAHLEIIAVLQERLQAGGGSTTDVVQAEARAARARNTLTERYNALREAEADFTRVVGHFPGELVQLVAPTGEALPSSLEDAVDVAVHQNPTVRIFEADVEAASAGVRVSESSFYPKVNLVAASSYEDEASWSDDDSGYTASNSVKLELDWNIFRGGIDVAGRQEALSRLAESKSDRYGAVVDAQRDVRQSWSSLEAARQSVSELAAAVRFNKQTVDAYLEQFEVAQRTLLDVLDAENELFGTRGQLITAMTNEQLSAYRVLALSGGLLSYFNVAAPKQSEFEDKGWHIIVGAAK